VWGKTGYLRKWFNNNLLTEESLLLQNGEISLWQYKGSAKIATVLWQVNSANS